MTTARSGRPPKVSKDEILDAARELLAGGADVFSMRKLSKHVGISLSSIYNHYESKDLIFQVLAEELVEDVWATLELTESWEDNLYMWSKAYWAMLRSNPAHIVLLSKITGSQRSLDQIDRLADFICQAGIEKQAALLKAQGLVWIVWGFATFSIGYREQRQRIENKPPQAPRYQDILSSLANEDTDALFETAIRDHILGIRASAAR